MYFIMVIIGKTLKQLRKFKNLSQSEVARKAKVSNEYIGKIERGESTNVGVETLETIANALGVPLGQLLNFGQTLALPDKKPLLLPSAKENRLLSLGFEPDLVKIPVLTGKVLAETFKQDFSSWDGDTMALPRSGIKNKNLVGWKIKGKHLEPHYMDGDHLIIDIEASAKDGDEIISARDGEEISVKQYKELQEDLIELRPFNQEFPTMQFKKGSHIDIIGVVCGVLRFKK